MLIRILVVIVFAPLTFLISPILIGLKGNLLRLIFIFGHGLFITLIILFFSNSPEIISNEETELMSASSDITSRDTNLGEKYVKDNILCFDVTPTTISYQTTDNRTRATVSKNMVDRGLLRQFLDSLSKQLDLIDIVVIDIDFTVRQSNDSALSKSIQSFAQRNKILIANPGAIRQDSGMNLSTDIYGDISEKTNKGLLISHEIYKNSSYSLAYKIFSHLEKVKKTKALMGRVLFETDSLGHSRIATNTFIPKLYIDDSTFVQDAGEPVGVLVSGAQRNEANYLSTLTYRSLDSATVYNFSSVINDLKYHRSHKKLNIILVGTFVGEHDSHQTSYGIEHGISIITNNFYNLLEHNHIVSISLFFELLLSLCIITWLMVFSKVYSISPDHCKGLMPNFIFYKYDILINKIALWRERKSHLSRTILCLTAIAKTIFEEFYLVLLILLVLLFYKYMLINGLSFVVYFTIVSRLLSQFLKDDLNGI